jgi:thiol-disulfide isomerase/thioredoxin
MRLRAGVAAVLAACLLGTAGCGGDAKAPAPAGAQQPPAADGTKPPGTAEPPAGVPVPKTLSFEAKTLDGKPFQGASLAGRPAVLWFWAPWCGTCASQTAGVVETATKHSGRVTVVGVAGLGRLKEMNEFVTDTGAGGITNLNDEVGAVWRRFKITQQSTYVLIDSAGTVVHNGYLDNEQFPERVDALAR